MPNTYSQIYLQLVFATKGRENKIGVAIKDELENTSAVFSEIKVRRLLPSMQIQILFIFYSAIKTYRLLYLT